MAENQNFQNFPMTKAIWAIQTLFGVTISLGIYIYSTNQKTQSDYNNRNDTKIIEMQKQILGLITNEATTKQILIQIQGDISENRETMKERFDKLETKIDRIK